MCDVWYEVFLFLAGGKNIGGTGGGGDIRELFSWLVAVKKGGGRKWF